MQKNENCPLAPDITSLFCISCGKLCGTFFPSTATILFLRIRPLEDCRDQWTNDECYLRNLAHIAAQKSAAVISSIAPKILN